MSSPTTDELHITLPFKDFLDNALGELDNVPIKRMHVAQVIAMTDFNEQFVHIQFEDLETGKPLNRPLMWNIKDWKTNYGKFLRDKKIAELRRIAANKQTDNITSVQKHLMKKFKLDEDTAKLAAQRMATKGNPEILKAMGISIEELLAEEKQALGPVTYLPNPRNVI